MNKVSQAIINKLTESPNEKVVTIYLPTHRHPNPPHITEDQTRFKNLVHKARSLVEADESHSQSLLKRIDELEAKIDDVEFWQNAIESLALFVTSEEVMMYHMPIECEEYVSYGDNFTITPLIMAQSYNQKFYVLSLAMHESKFYEGDMYGLQEVDVDLPKSVEDALHIDEMFANSQTKRSHRGGGANGPNAQTSPHGEGDSSEAGAQERLQYFRIIDNALSSYKNFDTKRPLVVAGTENEAGDFCAHTKLKNIVPSVLKGNYLHKAHSELHALVWPIIYKDIVSQREQDTIEQVSELHGVKKASLKLDDIEAAAKDGRVETLLVSMMDHTRDSVSDSSDVSPLVRISNDKDGRLRRLAHLVHQLGGQVLGVDTEVMPDGASVAAVYRY